MSGGEDDALELPEWLSDVEMSEVITLYCQHTQCAASYVDSVDDLGSNNWYR